MMFIIASNFLGVVSGSAAAVGTFAASSKLQTHLQDDWDNAPPTARLHSISAKINNAANGVDDFGNKIEAHDKSRGSLQQLHDKFDRLTSAVDRNTAVARETANNTKETAKGIGAFENRTVNEAKNAVIRASRLAQSRGSGY